MPIFDIANVFRSLNSLRNNRELEEEEELDEELDEEVEDELDEEDIEETSEDTYEEDDPSSSTSEPSEAPQLISDNSNNEATTNEANMIPIAPNQEWLDKNGWEYVGFRRPLDGEIFINAHFKLSTDVSSIGEQWDGKRWVIRPRASFPKTEIVQDKREEETPISPVPDVQL